jgi:hypothetical protein
MQPHQLSRTIVYQIDGLGDGAEYHRWVLTGFTSAATAEFSGPARERLVLDVGRLEQVDAGHLRLLAT